MGAWERNQEVELQEQIWAFVISLDCTVEKGLECQMGKSVAVNQARADEGLSLHNVYGDRRCI